MLKTTLFVALALAASAPCSAMKKTPYEFDGRSGVVCFQNESLYPVNLYLVHPDTGTGFPGDNTPFTTAGQSSTTLELDGEQMHLGSDWGIRLGSSPVKGLGAVSDWDADNEVFTITVYSFFSDKTQPSPTPDKPTPADTNAAAHLIGLLNAGTSETLHAR